MGIIITGSIITIKQVENTEEGYYKKKAILSNLQKAIYITGSIIIKQAESTEEEY